MGCWRWFNSILKEAGIEVRGGIERIDASVHEFIGEKAKYMCCSGDWKAMSKKVKVDEETRKKLVKNVRATLSV
jgi:hypothetical protein